MKPEELKHLLAGKRQWSEPLTPEEEAKGFKGWYCSKQLPHSFWEDDYFDRYIRDEEHLRRVVRYIENNPVKARLVPSAAEWLWSSARFRSKEDLSAKTLTHPTANRVPDKGF